MLCKPKRTIIVATDAELLNRHYYLRLWLAVRNLPISRRKWLDVIADAFLSEEGFNVIFPNGEPYPIPLVDEVFGEDFDMRWFSIYLLSDETGDTPKHHSRKLSRLRLLDLYFRIAHPNIAAHFGR